MDAPLAIAASLQDVTSASSDSRELGPQQAECERIVSQALTKMAAPSPASERN